MHGSGSFQTLLHTYSLTAALLLGSIVVFLEADCMEVPPPLQTVGPLENWRGRQTTPKKTVRSTGEPVLRTERSDAGCTHPSVLRSRLRVYRLNRLATNVYWLHAQSLQFLFLQWSFHAGHCACRAQGVRRSRTRRDAHSSIRVHCACRAQETR